MTCSDQVLEDAKRTKEDIDEVVIVDRSTRIRKIQQQVHEFFNGKEPHRGIYPDEAVAYGAAVLGGELSGKIEDFVLLDVTPASVGIETSVGTMSTLVQQITVIPLRKSRVCSTAEDNQPNVHVKVFEGEQPMTKDSHLLGEFVLKKDPQVPKGGSEIEVEFYINGIKC